MTRSLTLRRLRANRWTRELTQEVNLDYRQFVQPYFVADGLRKPEAIPGLTGVFRESPDSLLKRVESDLERGVHKVILFGVPGEKKESGFNYDFNSTQIAALRRQFGDALWISSDVCLCSYTSHGHCGILSPEGDHVINDQTVEELAKASLQYAQAGADCIAPSDMMDGRVGAIRDLLDQNKLDRTLIMSYSAKFHSGFYGPFRVAADSAPKDGAQSQLKDRATYQIESTRYQDALASSIRDAEEGADILMVKPGMPYLDVLQRLSQEIPLPWAVYQVSGEFASIELMAEKGLMDARRALLESWVAFKRAGAQMIISYGTRNAKEWIGQD